MATDYSNLSSQRETPQTHYLNSKVMSFEASDFPMMMYLNPLSSVASQPELFSGNSLPGRDYVDGVSGHSKEEVLLFAPPGHHMFLETNDREVDDAIKFPDRNKVFGERLLLEQNAELNLQHQPGLSLGLGNQVPSSIQMTSYQNAFTASGGSSVLSSHVEDHHSQNNALEKAEDFSFDLAMRSSNRFNTGSSYAPCSSISPKEINSNAKLQEDIVVGGMIYHSKYLKMVHELLDEFANVHQYLNHSKKHHNVKSFYQDVSGETSMLLDSRTLASSSSNELSPASQNDLHNKMTKLLSMLEEVDRKYNQYYQHMQCVESSLEIVAGLGAARRYTALALWTISRQFRCLRDAIKKQIQAVQKTLGEHGTIPNVGGVGLSRLRYLDQQMRQQRSLQQFGMVRQPWRPQRGLPETAVSVLRAWLFEHFLHPYPKDSEKILLARQTGLTRSQVANWFINARVRLWKPMIEDMYKEEFGEMGLDIQTSAEFEQAGRKPKDFEDTGEEPHESFTIKSAGGTQQTRSGEIRNSVNPGREGNAYMDKLSNQNNFQEEEKMIFELNKSWRGQTVSDQSNQNNDGSITAVSDTFNFSALDAAVGTQVSLALGVPRSENDSRPVGATAATSASSGLVDTTDYFCIDPLNQHDRFSNPHILSDFVV